MENYFASNLKHLRVQSGMTQTELAKKLDKDYSTIGKWELNQRNPIMEDIIKLSEIFNVSIIDLVNKDMRFPTNDKRSNNIEDDFTLFSKVLKSKGIIDENDNVSQEDFEKLIKFIDNNKDLLIKKDRD